MKLVLEITGLESGEFANPNGNGMSKWTRIRGKTSRGSYCRAVCYGDVGEKLKSELAKHTPRGEEIGVTRVVVDLTGEWKDDKEYQRPDGTMRTNRSFTIATFDILTGPHLELARLRRDGAERLILAEQHRAEGRLDMAYRTVAEFAALICNRPIDLSNLDEIMAGDDAEFGSAVNDGAPDPEAAAAARFASMDGVAEPMEIAAVQEAPAEIVEEDPAVIEIDEESLEDAVEANDETFEEDETVEEDGTQDASDAEEDEVAEAEEDEETVAAPVEEDVLDDLPEAPAAAAVVSAPPPARPVPGRSFPPARNFMARPPVKTPGM